MQIVLEIPGKPQGKQRPRKGRYGNIYTPNETVLYERLVKMCFEQAKPSNFKPYEGAVVVEIAAFFFKAKSNKMKHCILKPDVDNITKIILDGLNGTAYNDDKQVQALVVRKFWGVPDKVIVSIEELEDVAHEQ